MIDFIDVLAAIPLWLVALADGEAVRAALAAVMPEARAGELLILACEPSRLRMKEDGWSGSYLVTVSAPDGDVRQVRLRGTLLEENAPGVPTPSVPFGDPAWRMALPDARLVLSTESADADLPSLPTLTDPESARSLLESAIGAAGSSYAGYRLRVARPQIMRHKPGSRCTILYRLEYDEQDRDREWPGIVVAKTYRGNKGHVAWRGMQELWHSPMRSSGITLAEPLAYLPDINVLVQGPVPEDRTLKDAIRSAVASGQADDIAAVTDSVRATAAGLAALHQCGVRHGELVTWDDELSEVQRVMDRIGRYAPEAGSTGTALLQRLVALAGDAPADPAGPAHRSFRPAQVLLHEADLGFIDFDGFCQAEPAIDVALFRTTVRALAKDPSQRPALARLADEFLAEYRRHGVVSPRRVALWEGLDLLTSLQHAWTKVKPEKAADALAALRAHLSEGLALTETEKAPTA